MLHEIYINLFLKAASVYRFWFPLKYWKTLRQWVGLSSSSNYWRYLRISWWSFKIDYRKLHLVVFICFETFTDSSESRWKSGNRSYSLEQFEQATNYLLFGWYDSAIIGIAGIVRLNSNSNFKTNLLSYIRKNVCLS